MSFIHEHRKQQQYYRPKNRFKHQNLNNNLHLKSKKDDKWLEPVLNQTYNWFSPLFNSDDDLFYMACALVCSQCMHIIK